MTAHIRHHLHIRMYTFIFRTHFTRHYLHIRRYISYSDTYFTFGTFYEFNTLYIGILHIRIHECPIESLPLDHNPWGAVSKMADSVSVLRNELIDIIAGLDTVEHWDFSDQVRDAIHRRLDQLWRVVFQLIQANVLGEDVLSCIGEAVELLQQWEQSQETTEEQSRYRTMLLPTGRRGRPRFDINPEQLEYLLENGFTGPDIA